MKTKFIVSIKDPDVFYEAVQNASLERVNEIAEDHDLEREEREVLIESSNDRISKLMKKWLKYGECCSIEFDLEAMTATVLEGEND